MLLLSILIIVEVRIKCKDAILNNCYIIHGWSLIFGINAITHDAMENVTKK